MTDKVNYKGKIHDDVVQVHTLQNRSNVPDDVRHHRPQTKTDCCKTVSVTLPQYTAVHTLSQEHSTQAVSISLTTAIH